MRMNLLNCDFGGVSVMVESNNEIVSMTVNERIAYYTRKYRKENGMTQKELADLLFVEPQTISAWERGLKTPNSDSITNLTNLIGISADLIYKGTSSFETEQVKYPSITKDTIIISNDSNIGSKVRNSQYRGNLYEVTIYFKYRLYLWKPSITVVFPSEHTEKVRMGDAFTFYSDRPSGSLKIQYYGQVVDFNYTLSDKSTYFSFDTKRLTNGKCALDDTNAKLLKINKENIESWWPRIFLYIALGIFVLFCLISLDI